MLEAEADPPPLSLAEGPGQAGGGGGYEVRGCEGGLHHPLTQEHLLHPDLPPSPPVSLGWALVLPVTREEGPSVMVTGDWLDVVLYHVNSSQHSIL